MTTARRSIWLSMAACGAALLLARPMHAQDPKVAPPPRVDPQTVAALETFLRDTIEDNARGGLAGPHGSTAEGFVPAALAHAQKHLPAALGPLKAGELDRVQESRLASAAVDRIEPVLPLLPAYLSLVRQGVQQRAPTPAEYDLGRRLLTQACELPIRSVLLEMALVELHSGLMGVGGGGLMPHPRTEQLYAGVEGGIFGEQGVDVLVRRYPGLLATTAGEEADRFHLKYPHKKLLARLEQAMAALDKAGPQAIDPPVRHMLWHLSRVPGIADARLELAVRLAETAAAELATPRDRDRPANVTVIDSQLPRPRRAALLRARIKQLHDAVREMAEDYGKQRDHPEVMVLLKKIKVATAELKAIGAGS